MIRSVAVKEKPKEILRKIENACLAGGFVVEEVARKVGGLLERLDISALQGGETDRLRHALFSAKDENGWTVAHWLAERCSESVQLKVIELGKEKIFDVNNVYGWTVAIWLAEYGSESVRLKVFELGKEKIFDVRDDVAGTVALTLVDNGFIVPVLRLAGKIRGEEAELTGRVLAAIHPLKWDDYRRIYLHRRVHDNLPFIFDYIAEVMYLSSIVPDCAARLAKALESRGGNVERVVAARGIVHALRNWCEEELRSAFKHEGKDLLKTLGLVPVVSALSKAGMLSNPAAILGAEDVESELGKELTKKISDVFGFGPESKETIEALKNTDFVVDLLTFDALYGRDAPQARIVLRNVMQNYFASGVEGFKQFKFYGHQLADEQLGSAAGMKVKEKLLKLDELHVIRQMDGTERGLEVFKTQIDDYNAHKGALHQKADELSKSAKTELERIGDDAGLPAGLRNAISNRDMSALRNDFGGGERAKAKAIALINIEGATEAITLTERLIEDIGKLGGSSGADFERGLQIAVNGLRPNGSIGNGDEPPYDMLIKKLSVLSARDNLKGEAELALRNMISIIKEVGKSWDRGSEAISAGFTFDPSEILTFGRYGSSGGGNCQNSKQNNAEFNQSLMSMLADANQFMVKFKSVPAESNQFMTRFQLEEGETLGFMQVHMLQSTKGMILLFENPYTNQPNKAPVMRNAAMQLAGMAEKLTGMPAYFRDGDENGDTINVKIPGSYVNRYIDFIQERIGAGSVEAVTNAVSLHAYDPLLRILR